MLGVAAAPPVDIPPVVTYPTLDSANKDTDIILSNGDMDAESNEPAGGGSVISLQPKNTGKYYFEVKQVQQYATNPGFLSGLMRGTTDVPTFTGASTESWALASTASGSDTWTGGSSSNNSAEGVASLSAYHKCAVDLTLGRIWLAASNRASGAWIGGGDPAANTSPTFTYTPDATPLRISLCPRRGHASTSSDRNRLRLRVNPADWEGTPPSGFGAWSETDPDPEIIQGVFTSSTPEVDDEIPAPLLALIGSDLDIEWTAEVQYALQENSTAFTAWSLDDGDQRLRYTGGMNGDWILTINSSDVVTASMIDLAEAAGQRAMDGQLLQVRAWRDRLQGTMGIRVGVNGVFAYDRSISATGSDVPTPTTGFLNSVSGGSPNADIRQVLFTSYGPDASRVQSFNGCVLGDSTIASYGEDSGVPTASLLRSGGVCKNRFIKSLAIGGATTAQQQTKWEAFTQKADLKWIIVQVGLNDIDPAEAASLAIGRIQDLINEINTDRPADSLLYIATMIPCYQRMITRYGAGAPADNSLAKWEAMNEAIRGEGGSPITGVDGRISSHTTTMDDGVGNLAALYDSGDGIHPNNVGRQVIADSWLEIMGHLL